MPLFGSRSTAHRHHGTTTRRRGLFHRRDKDRVAGGFKAALSNPNTTRSGRRHAKHELRAMGRGNETHVPLMTKIKRALGIRSTPRNKRIRANRTPY
ncbi:hypothetical protein GALMADRAFT_132961 [Galerina marginata CBS 339.88]|uniref:Uncharacterized protein n=1 Tax=Galerina marginata (strain CBS 339.88) TaxID=685588 RepID=A0A067TJY5_GALM3|nr:hypothetical protein GALMADRAFT_132961 [Galerina marginata CBS 339.88]